MDGIPNHFLNQSDNELSEVARRYSQMRGMAAMPTRLWPLSLKMEPFAIRTPTPALAEKLLPHM